jgi:hypothetical protein
MKASVLVVALAGLTVSGPAGARRSGTDDTGIRDSHPISSMVHTSPRPRNDGDVDFSTVGNRVFEVYHGAEFIGVASVWGEYASDDTEGRINVTTFVGGRPGPIDVWVNPSSFVLRDANVTGSHTFECVGYTSTMGEPMTVETTPGPAGSRSRLLKVQARRYFGDGQTLTLMPLANRGRSYIAQHLAKMNLGAAPGP